MTIEEKLPEKFRSAAFHPSLFVYAFKRNVLDKLFEELLASNIAILRGEAWVVEGEKSFGVIPLKDGGKEVLNWKVQKKETEEWYDFVERSIKETIEVISKADLDKKVSSRMRPKIWYHFDLSEE